MVESYYICVLVVCELHRERWSTVPHSTSTSFNVSQNQNNVMSCQGHQMYSRLCCTRWAQPTQEYEIIDCATQDPVLSSADRHLVCLSVLKHDSNQMFSLFFLDIISLYFIISKDFQRIINGKTVQEKIRSSTIIKI